MNSMGELKARKVFRQWLTSKPIPALRHTATHSSPSPKPIPGRGRLQEGPGCRKTAYLTQEHKPRHTGRGPLQQDPKQTPRSGALPARLPGLASRPHPEAPVRPVRPTCAARLCAPPAGPLTRSFSRWLSGCGLALPSTLSATSVPGTSPTRGRRPGPALYGRGHCRKLLWPQLSMLGNPPTTGSPSPAGSEGAAQSRGSARTAP
ncbi:unnamed protein product [Rangifer tarandus platyrhynchus]|uniref:Uncharacterized protein n=2 Tax=Rangifer tarandus platyrhynchus TaxID=3082113 RepID=A0ABN8YCF0_RANTA|nr:unnamed protein product [Rangifer tarandus platyrhynchus]CAI9698395.1 unnamed protein product [Rangifer tarandus platyrhynchus]